MTKRELCEASADWQVEDDENRVVVIAVSDRRGDSRDMLFMVGGEEKSIIRMLAEAMGHDSQFRYIIERSVAAREILGK